MTEEATATDRFRAVLVLAATAGTIVFNWLAAAGRISGVTPAEISEKYPTLITPAGYAFTIWTLIYVGMAAFSIYQLLPANLVRCRVFRSPYIASCALNCAWIYFWHSEQIAICAFLIVGLLVVLFAMNSRLVRTEGLAEFWFVKAPFSIYFGWVTAAALINIAVLLVFLGAELSSAASTAVAVGSLLLAGALGILARIKLNSFLHPLAIAWAATAIAVKQSGNTVVVLAAAAVVIACLFAALSFVVGLPSTDNPRKAA